MGVNKAKVAAKERKLVDAIGSHFNGSDALSLDGVAYKAKDIAKMLQDHIDAASSAEALKGQWQTAAAVAQAAGDKVTGILPALRTLLINQFGGSSQAVRDFGFTPKKRTTTVKAQAAGIAKREATRKAREAGAAVPEATPATEAPKPAATAVTNGQSATSATS